MIIPGYDQNSPEMQMQGGGDDEQQDNQPQGDGLNHHEIHEMPDGTAHSTHTDPEGNVEEKDHDSYEQACADCGGDSGNDEEDGADAGDSFADDGEDEPDTTNIAKSYGSKAKQ